MDSQSNMAAKSASREIAEANAKSAELEVLVADLKQQVEALEADCSKVEELQVRSHNPHTETAILALLIQSRFIGGASGGPH